LGDLYGAKKKKKLGGKRGICGPKQEGATWGPTLDMNLEKRGEAAREKKFGRKSLLPQKTYRGERVSGNEFPAASEWSTTGQGRGGPEHHAQKLVGGGKKDRHK